MQIEVFASIGTQLWILMFQYAIFGCESMNKYNYNIYIFNFVDFNLAYIHQDRLSKVEIDASHNNDVVYC